MKTILVDAMHTFVERETGIFQDMYELLEKYPNKKIILTNSDDKEIKATGLDAMPYEVFSLGHNPDKIDQKYFIALLNRYSLKAQDVIYFDHSKKVVDVARSIGINTFWFDSEIKDLVGLKIFLDKFAN